MKPSSRFLKIAQLLFSGQIDEDEINTAKKAIDMFNKAEIDFNDWLETIQKNLDVFNNYHGKETSLVIISEAFEDTMKKQKEKYEKIILSIKQAIEILDKIQDVEMQDMITNFAKTTEGFTSKYNELTDMTSKIGDEGFIQVFKDNSQKIIDGSDSFFDVLGRVKDYMIKNILDEQSLS